MLLSTYKYNIKMCVNVFKVSYKADPGLGEDEVLVRDGVHQAYIV